MYIQIYNKDNLKDAKIQKKIIRSRAVIINSEDEILLGVIDKTYQFPGGHAEGKETAIDALVREVKEETGILIPRKNYEPFHQIRHYDRNFPKEGINSYTELNYFLINTDMKYDLRETNYDNYEKKYNYTLEYVKLSEFLKTLQSTLNERERNKEIYKEMVDVMNSYYKYVLKKEKKLKLDF